MDQFICNKCYCKQDKIKQPFELTQCGHIFCHNCFKEVKNKCSECNATEIKSVPLTESLVPKLSKLFTPLSDILTSIKSLIIFQSEQRNIFLECFHQIDYKYQILKYRYANAIQIEKQIIYEYSNLKKYEERLKKKYMFIKMNSTDSKTVYVKPCLMCHRDTAIKNISGLYALNKP